MNKFESLKILLSDPISTIKTGIRNQQQQYYKNQILKIYKLHQLPTIDILDLIPNLNEKIEPYSFLKGTSSLTDFILLKSLAKQFEKCSYLEIGSWRGESLSNIRDVTSDCTSITLSKNEMKAMNFSDNFIKSHGIFSNRLDGIKCIEENSQKYDFRKLNKQFDLIFIDGDHTYEGILSDTKKTFPLRKNKKSIIVWHDYGFDFEKIRYTTLKAILDGIPQELHKNLYHVSNTMCAVYIENINYITYETKFPSKVNKYFSINIKATRLNE